MSVIHVDVGTTGWCRAWICDHCGRRVERVLTGERGTAFDWPSAPDGQTKSFDYDEEIFEGDGHPFRGWARVEVVTDRDPERQLQPDLHLCPSCAPALLDALLTKCTPPTALTESARNVVEVPR